MVIRNSNIFNFAHRQMNRHNSNMLRALQRLSSGYRINSAADDPAGLAISERMRAQITGMNQAVRNARTGRDMVDTADGALQEVHAMLDRLVDLTTRAASATLTDTQRTALQAEADEIMKELKRTAEATSFAGIDLLNGKSKPESLNPSEIKLQVGPTSNPYDQIAIQFPNLNTAINMLDGLSLMTPEAAQSALASVNTAVDAVSEMRGNLGAASNRLDYSINALEVTAENLTEAESRIRDADMAKEMMNYIKASVGSQAAQFVMAHAMQEPYRVLDLIKSMGS